VKTASTSSYTEIGTGDPIEEQDRMEFRLLYSGKLLGTSRDNTRADLKHKLRRVFHPQLRRLWDINQNLKVYAKNFSPNKDDVRAGLEGISNNWNLSGYHFVPLITERLFLRCKIDVLFLRPNEPHHIMQSGDLDSKLKTIFDALRLPKSLEEAGGMGPQEDETPFFCLLEDDKLISQVSINADQLLVLPTERQADPNDAFLVIHVQLNANPGTPAWFFD
jgi:hypothetical protein